VFFNYTASFFIVGLWHGTYLSYLLWGLSQGVGLAVRRIWHLRFEALRERHSPWYHRLRAMGLIDSPLSRGLSWLLTFHYQILTICLFLDEQHSWRLLGPRLLLILGIEIG